MIFDIKNKVAIVTGGASGIGLKIVKELLKNDARGVTIADLDENIGKNALALVQAEFGSDKAIFVQMDTTKKDQFEGAFKKTIETFKNVDILFNNAGILNDALWEKEIAVNLNGTINGITLAHENYIAKFKSGDEGVIVNTSSIAGVNKFPGTPVYSATKFAVHGLTIGFGDDVHYQRSRVRVIGICPGVTNTSLVTEAAGKTLGPAYDAFLKDDFHSLPIQSADKCAEEVMGVLKNAPSGTMWVIEGGKPSYEYKLLDRETFKTNN